MERAILKLLLNKWQMEMELHTLASTPSKSAPSLSKNNNNTCYSASRGFGLPLFNTCPPFPFISPGQQPVGMVWIYGKRLRSEKGEIVGDIY